MAERDDLVAALTAEVLGPRGGVRERLEAPPHRAGEFITPLEEYITGVLAPRDAQPSSDMAIDASDDLLGEDDESADDQGDAGAPVVPPGATPIAGPGRSPSLDPRSRPCSIGLSVLIDGPHPNIDICSTWAWYELAGTTAWQREPRYDIWTGVDCTRPRDARVVAEPDGVRRVSIEVRCRPSGGVWRVSVFLLNSTNAPRPGPEHHVYQPQVRVRIGEHCRLLPLDDDAPPSDAEAASLALLYSRRRALARGHLCGAMWRDVDPEQPFLGIQSAGPPLVWLDGSVLPPGAAPDFSPPDARTELVPCYLIQAPRLNASPLHGSAVFDPELLSETWDATDLRNALTPLADAYQSWITLQQQGAQQLPPQHQAAASGHLQQCQKALRRIREGIDLLCTDDAARLAFCFANKAIAVQSRWTRDGVVSPWRPFQLAFQLVNMTAIRRAQSPERLVCDLLWVPTGGGKTEAYLGLAAFTFALRRLDARASGSGDGGGVSVLSRYTLRLLTIQQFRRALALITACETLRVSRSGNARGWRPKECHEPADQLWGGSRFAIGLWVGGNVTPNGLFDIPLPPPHERIRGALSILRGESGDGEPAQVLTCPACGSVLAVPPEGFSQGRPATVHLVIECQNPNAVAAASISGPMQPGRGGAAPAPLFAVTAVQLTTHANADYHTLSISFVPARDVSPADVDRWAVNQILPACGRRARLACARASRPGYFFRTAPFRGGRVNDVDFEVFCPRPDCTLNTGQSWSEDTPLGPFPILPAFESGPGRCSRVPVSALTVDDQVYHRCPTMVVSTVDKFARLAFEPRAASLFGVVDHYCDRHGYYRAGCPPTRVPPTSPTDHPQGVTPVPVQGFAPPDLILQDELHLIEGPLGSMVGLYETAIETLASRTLGGARMRPKYIASSATVRRAADQVQSLYDRSLAQFPPPGLRIDDNFFSSGGETHPLDAGPPGRLYVGICAPGRGAQTPIVRIWSRLLQQVEARRQAGVLLQDLDGFWTLVGYFNAIRELAGAVALARQDIPERMAFISPAPRSCPEDEPLDLSSRASSLELPGMLERLGERLGVGNPVATVVSTSMFGTGVDVPRLGLMIVHGQPKTSSSYIQATGRVGRERGGLVVTFYRASRPRDLSHFEFFVGYHRELYRHVEPISVNPFSPRARDRALGPVSVAILRQGSEIPGATPVQIQGKWRIQQRFQGGWRCRAGDMAAAQALPEVAALAPVFEARGIAQPPGRRPQPGVVGGEANAEVARWAQLAALAGQALLYHESSMISPPSNMVVLGDLAHETRGLPVAFENAPTSLREVESTTTFRGRP
ncbi:MAG: hypothetical protein DIJKHBIC_02924 [Thermoanaerobaculia bacterium]|nr:hypothetical protein [Thermoanaerobaculia bacterium]